MGTATDIIWAAAAVAIITDGVEAAGIIRAGAITAADADFRWRGFRRSIAPTRADAGDMDGRAERRDQFNFSGFDAGHLKPISTAIRIRSEWFFAPSFCLSSDVVLATVL